MIKITIMNGGRKFIALISFSSAEQAFYRDLPGWRDAAFNEAMRLLYGRKCRRIRAASKLSRTRGCEYWKITGWRT